MDEGDRVKLRSNDLAAVGLTTFLFLTGNDLKLMPVTSCRQLTARYGLDEGSLRKS